MARGRDDRAADARRDPTRRDLLAAGAGLAAAAAVTRPRPAAAATGTPAPLGGVGGRWGLTFAEDFCDPAGFEERWIRVTSGGDQHETLRLPENVVAEACSLDLDLGHQDDPRRPYTGGYAKTRSFRQTYGYFECAMRIADETGVNNAFWLVSDPATERDGFAYELDVAEAKAPDVLNVAVHRWRPKPKWAAGEKIGTGLPLARGFHRYALLWSPETFVFFLDDREVWRTGNAIAHSPAEIRLSNAVAAFAGKTDGDVAGAATTVKWVRVYAEG